MRIRQLAFAAALGFVSVANVDLQPRSVWADSTGTIEGVVKDSKTGDPLAGVTIIVTSPAMKGTQAVISDDNGFWRVAGLSPGEYTYTLLYASNRENPTWHRFTIRFGDGGG